MRRSLGRAARSLAVAGALFGLVDATQAQPLFRFWGSKTTTSQPPATPAGVNPLERLEEIQVELAWLSDPSTFPCPLTAKVRGRLLEVGGLAPNQPIKQQALELARQSCSLPIADAIKIRPGVGGRHPSTEPMESLARTAATALAKTFGERVHEVQVQAQDTGQLILSGTVFSYEEMLNISRLLRQVHGVSSIDNQLTVTPTMSQGQMVTLISSDGRLALSTEAAPPAPPAPPGPQALPAPPAPSNPPAPPTLTAVVPQPEYQATLPLTATSIQPANSSMPAGPTGRLLPIAAQAPAPIPVQNQPLPSIDYPHPEVKNPLLTPPPVPQSLKTNSALKSATPDTPYSGAYHTPLTTTALPTGNMKLLPNISNASTLQPVAGGSFSTNGATRSATGPSSGDQVAAGVVFLDDSGSSKTKGAKAPQATITPAMLQYRVEAACAGLARDVQVEVMPDGIWAIKVRVLSNLDKQVTEKIMRLEEMVSPRMRLELTLLP